MVQAEYIVVLLAVPPEKTSTQPLSKTVVLFATPQLDICMELYAPETLAPVIVVPEDVSVPLL